MREEVEQPADNSQASILLVDDHPENLTALEAILSPLGERLVCARSGPEALREVLRNDFAVILMDVQMPMMHGFETATLIREREKSAHIPMIFVTAVSKDQDAIFQGYAVGAVDYISKPLNPTVLASKVQVFVDLYKKNKELARQSQQLHEAELRESERRLKEREREIEMEAQRALQVELELRVAERTSQLVAANAEMEAFCYSVSHDLRAPLRSINATSMMLLQEASDKLSEEEVQHLMKQAGAAKKLGHLIDDLLQLFRLGRKSLSLTQADMTSIAEEVVSELSGRYVAKMKVTIPPNLKVYADPGLLRVMLYNLFDNAFKYSPKGGRITLGEEPESPGTFFLKDEGIGFDMNYVGKLFLPFERLVAEGDFPGTGIGLALVRRIVHRHGGEIWAESLSQKGSTFRFRLTK